MRGFTRQLKKNVLIGSAAAALNLAMVAVSYPVYLHFLGYERYGLWLVISTILAFSRIGDLGISQALSKLIAEARGKGDHKGSVLTIREALKILTLTALTIGATLQLVLPYFISPSHEIHHLLPFLSLLAGLGILTEAFPGILSGIGRMDLGQSFVICARAAGMGLSILLLASGQGMASLVWGTLITYLCIIGSCWWVAHSHISLLGPAAPIFRKQLLILGSQIMGGNGLSLFMHPLNRLLLAHYAGLAAVPIYDIAYRGAMQLRALLEAGLRALMPAYSELSGAASDQLFKLQQSALKFTRWGGAVIYLIVALGLDSFLRFWLATSYLPEITEAFMLTLTASYFSLLGVPLYYFAMGTGHIRHCFFTHLIQAAAHLVFLGTCIYFTGTLSSKICAAAPLCAFFLSYCYLQRHVLTRSSSCFVSPKSPLSPPASTREST